MRIPHRLFVEPVTVRTYGGQNAYGDTYGEPVAVLGHVAGGSRVQTGAGGDELLSGQTVMLNNPCRLADGSGTVDPTELITTESLVESGTVSGRAVLVTEHREPGTGRVVYVSARLQ